MTLHRARHPVLLCVVGLSVLAFLLSADSAESARRRKKRPNPREKITNIGSVAQFQASIRGAIRRECPRPNRLSLIVRTLLTGETLYEHHADDKRIPASNAKILTTAAALSELGPDYTFPTDVYADGSITGGVLRGNLYLKGYGDPFLVQERLRELAHSVRLRGIRMVTGDIIADDTFFGGGIYGRGWRRPGSRPFLAPNAALALNFSVVTVHVDPSENVGTRARVQLDPPSDGITLNNRVVTARRGLRPKLRVVRRRDNKRNLDVIHVSGRIPLEWRTAEFRVAISDPTRFAASAFASFLKDNGIGLSGRIREGATPKDARLIERQISKPLANMVEGVNKFSNNFMAEMVLKTLGAEKFGPPGTSAKGLRAVRDFLVGIGIPVGSFELADGSGLSRQNRITARSLATVLERVHHDFRIRPEFVSSLAVVGVDGTIRKRLRGSGAARRIRAKTGYLNGVEALSGYAAAKNGEILVFSSISNGNACRFKSLTRRVGLAMTSFERSLPNDLRNSVRWAPEMLGQSMPRPSRRDQWRSRGRARISPAVSKEDVELGEGIVVVPPEEDGTRPESLEPSGAAKPEESEPVTNQEGHPRNSQ